MTDTIKIRRELEPHITSIRYSSAPVRKKPKAGDTKFVKKTGKTMIRQQAKHGGAYLVSNGRPVWEWVEKGGELDREHQWENMVEEPSNVR